MHENQESASRTWVSKKEWTSLFRQIGLSEDDMMRWHHLFEKHHPEAHQAFLGWLQIPAEENGEIRQKSRVGTEGS